MNDEAQSNSGLLLGGVLVLLGGLFLVRNFTDLADNVNWWALFILIPAAGSLSSAWRRYQAQGAFTAEARGPLLVGLAFLLATVVFLFNLSWGTLWPVFLILGGVALLLAR